MVSVGFSTDEQWPLWISQGVVMATIVVISFYYVDLYAIDQALSGRELLLRFMNGFGVACIAIGIVTYPIPELGFRAIYFSEMILMGLCLYSWRLQFMRMIRRAPQSGKVDVTLGFDRRLACGGHVAHAPSAGRCAPADL